MHNSLKFKNIKCKLSIQKKNQYSFDQMHISDKMRTNHENSRKTMVQNNIEKFIVKSPSKEHRHYQFLWFILQFRRNYLLEYSVCFNKVSHKYYFSSSIVLCWTMLKPLFFFKEAIMMKNLNHYSKKYYFLYTKYICIKW